MPFRYVSNKVFDADRQRAICLLNGTLRPSLTGPDVLSMECCQQGLPKISEPEVSAAEPTPNFATATPVTTTEGDGSNKDRFLKFSSFF